MLISDDEGATWRLNNDHEISGHNLSPNDGRPNEGEIISFGSSRPNELYLNARNTNGYKRIQARSTDFGETWHSVEYSNITQGDKSGCQGSITYSPNSKTMYYSGVMKGGRTSFQI